MNIQEQGVLLKNRLYSLGLFNISIRPLLFSLLFLTYTATPAIANSETKSQSDTHIKKHQIFIVHSPENKLQSRIAEALSNTLSQLEAGYVIKQVTPDENLLTIDRKSDLIVSIGRKNLKSAKKHLPNTRSLFISTDTDAYKNDIKTNKKEAILYITQPFCRQLRLIQAINKNWRSVSILSSQKKIINTTALNKCAKRFNLKLHIEKIENDGVLSKSLKDALGHSDLLLAIPDKSVYNRKTVKNILLTSYRFRKPVIGFSGSFVKAGALASIHSNTDQIAKSASNIIHDYFKGKQKFTNAINYPQLFDVSINRQVFRALGIAVPDIDRLKQDIVHTDTKASGLSK